MNRKADNGRSSTQGLPATGQRVFNSFCTIAPFLRIVLAPGAASSFPSPGRNRRRSSPGRGKLVHGADRRRQTRAAIPLGQQDAQHPHAARRRHRRRLGHHGGHPDQRRQAFVTTKINTYGAGVVTISKMPQTFITLDEYLDFQKRKDITFDDYRAVLSECRSCVSVGARSRAPPATSSTATTSTTDTDIRGWTWTMPAISNLNIETGPLLHRVEDDAQRPRRHRRLRHRRQPARPRRSAGQRDSRRRRALHRHRRRRAPGQNARPEHGQLGRRPPHRVSRQFGAHRPWTSTWMPAVAAK